MKVTQIYELMNQTTSEILGESIVLQEDLTNIVDVGNEIISTENVDNYVKKLVNHIGKVVFDNKKYSGSVPSVFMDSWEYGSILEKITSEIPEATENESWNLVDGQSYNDDVFYQPKISAKFFNSKVTFEVPVSFTELQVKESFSNKSQLNGFLSMIFNSVEKAMTIKIDSLVMRAINNMTAETLASELEDSITTGTYNFNETGIRAVNLLNMYNAQSGKSLVEKDALQDKEFIRFATHTINLYKDRMTKISTLFNVGGKTKFTSKDDLTTVLLTDFASSIGVYGASDIINNEFLDIGKYDTVPYWQGSGEDYSLSEVSKIDVKTSTGKIVSTDGILGVMFDKQAVGVSNLDRRVTSKYNAKAEFFTNYYKMDAGYLNDLDENFIVFFIG